MLALSTLRRYPSSVYFLIFLSFILTISRAATIPFITVYLTHSFHLSPENIGFVLGGSYFLGIISNIYGGYLVDKCPRFLLLLTVTIGYTLSFFLLLIANSTIAVFLILALLQATYTILLVVIKAHCANSVNTDKRIKVFSMNYTSINIGWAIGPSLGSMVVSYYAQTPFLFSGVVSVISLLIILFTLKQKEKPHNQAKEEKKPPLRFTQTVLLLKTDRRLLLFTIATMLGAMVNSQFTSYLSQYLVTRTSTELTYQMIGSVMTINAIVIICFQYLLSSKISQQHLMRWLVIGAMLYIFGLIGFMSSLSLTVWSIAMIIFSLGEVTVVPASYLFIDFIAPSHLKGSYYGIQSLGNIGGAINPALCGLLLSFSPSYSMFYMLIACMLASVYFFYRGLKITYQ